MPGVPRTVTGPFDALVASIATQGLPRSRPVVEIELDDAQFTTLLDVVSSERITGHLDRALAAGWIVADHAQREAALARHEQMLAVDLALERLLAETSALLDAAGIRHRALKGAAVARTAYPDPALRSFGDVDLLIAAEHFDDAVDALERRGGRARYGQPRRGFTARFGKGVCVETDRGLELDLHRVFVAGPYGLAIDTDDLFEGAETITIGDTAVPVPSAPVRFLHACYHVALTNPRITAARDVAQIACATDLDFDRVLAIARRWRGRAVVQRALQTTAARLPVELPGPFLDWAGAYEPDRFERAAMRPYVSDRRSYAAQMATGIWALDGIRPRVQYVVALLLPDREYLRARDGSYVRRWRRALGIARDSNRAR